VAEHRNPIDGSLEPCSVPEDQVPLPPNFDNSVVIIDPDTGNAASINDDGQLHVVLRGDVCDDCSTTTPLGAGATFTGEPTDILDYSMVTVSVTSDVDSASGGVRIEQSHDGTNWDFVEPYTLLAGQAKTWSAKLDAKYLRVVYINGSSPQGYIRLQTIRKKMNSATAIHKLGDDLSVEDDGNLTKSVLSAEHSDGSFKNVDVHHPMSVDSHVIFSKDLDLSISDNGNFSGVVTDYFDSLLTVNSDATVNNPKEILLWFNNTVYASAIGFGCNDLAKSFSNIEIEFLGSGQEIRYTYDQSTDNTKRNSFLVELPPLAFNGMRLKFHTNDEIGLSNVTIRKEQKNVSQIQAIKEDGTTVNIGASDSGNLRVTNAESGLAIAQGGVTGTTFIHKFGAAPLFNVIDGFVDIWDGANSTLVTPSYQYTFSSTADIDSVSSTNAADTQQIEIQGLDTNWNMVTQTVTLTGQTPVTLSTPLLRAFRMINVGTVDLLGEVYLYINGATVVGGAPTLGTDIRAIINNGNNQTLMAIYTIPAGKTGYLRDWYAATAGARKTSVHIIHVDSREFGRVFTLKHVSSIISTGSSQVQHKYVEPEVFPEKTDIIMHGNTDEDSAALAAGFDIVLVDN
jgi:hypothetical protein